MGNKGYFNIKAGDNLGGIETAAFYFDLKWDSWSNIEGCGSFDYNEQYKIFYCQSCIYGYWLDR